MRNKFIFCIFLSISACALAETQKSLFNKAASSFVKESKVPVFIPTKLPEIISKYGIHAATGSSTSTGYEITFYFGEETLSSAFAGNISGSTVTFEDLPNTNKVLLSNGETALFRSVTCGGSCAPANLWWQINGFEYSIQLKLLSTMEVNKQKTAILEVANSVLQVK